jgi:hypothetical protein
VGTGHAPFSQQQSAVWVGPDLFTAGSRQDSFQEDGFSNVVRRRAASRRPRCLARIATSAPRAPAAPHDGGGPGHRPGDQPGGSYTAAAAAGTSHAPQRLAHRALRAIETCQFRHGEGSFGGTAGCHAVDARLRHPFEPGHLAVSTEPEPGRQQLTPTQDEAEGAGTTAGLFFVSAQGALSSSNSAPELYRGSFCGREGNDAPIPAASRRSGCYPQV